MICNCRLSITDSGEIGSEFNYHTTTLRNYQFRAFTLIEMTVVIAIIILLAGLVVPAATQIWRDRKIADAQNIITGMLTTARARAIQSGGAETGLFFFLDDQGYQRVAPITQNPNDQAETDQNKIIKGWEADGRWYNVFTVLRDRSFTLPSPMRVIPLYALCADADAAAANATMCSGRAPYQRFSDNELTNNVFDAMSVAPGTVDTAQLHRNFFTLVFAPNGEMIVGRNVMIRDIDDAAVATSATKGKGVVTLARTEAPSGGVGQYYPFSAPPGDQVTSFTGSGAVSGIAQTDYPPAWLLTDSSGVAIGFPSVDGLLVYDDSLFNEAGDIAAKRSFLKERGLPFYINRLSGAVVRGPSGETP